MSLNGRNMQVGDIVHDILKGAGKVVNDGGGVLSVTVDFGAGGKMSFAQDGTFGGVQRLYWKQPYIFQPEGPDDEAYELALDLAKKTYEWVKSYEKRNKGCQ